MLEERRVLQSVGTDEEGHDRVMACLFVMATVVSYEFGFSSAAAVVKASIACICDLRICGVTSRWLDALVPVLLCPRSSSSAAASSAGSLVAPLLST